MARLCPICEQGSSLAFVACPGCGWLIVRCEEEGTIFPNPRSIEGLRLGKPDVANCQGCGERPIAEFTYASDEAIRAGGFSPSDYE